VQAKTNHDQPKVILKGEPVRKEGVYQNLILVRILAQAASKQVLPDDDEKAKQA
jgi:hypothetical protein